MLSNGRTILIGIVLISVLLRIGSAVYQGDAIGALPGVADEISYHTLAQRVLDGHGFSFDTGWWPVTRANQPTAHWSFLYVLFLSAIYAIAGAVPLAARVVQAVLAGVLHPWLAWRIGSRVFGVRVGLVSAGISACYGYFVFYAGALVTESLYFVALLWVLDVATSIALSPRPDRWLRRWVMLGLAIGTAVLLRQAFLLVVPAILAWLAWDAWRTRPAGAGLIPTLRPVIIGASLAAAVTAACLLPWTARNYHAFGQFVLLNTNAGYVFFYGAHPVHGTRFVPLQADGSAGYFQLLPPQYRRTRLNEAALERALLAEGFRFVREDPARYARVSLSRAVEFFKFWPSRESGRASSLLRVFSFGLLLPLVLAGSVLALRGAPGGGEQRWSGAILLLGLASVYALLHLLTWTLVRYRLPIDAMAVPLAALAVVTAVSRVWPAAESKVPVAERSAV
jgi:hypothetical protein